jgi:ribonuclease HI
MGHESGRTASLFGAQPKPPESYLIAYIDGGARGNPGPAGYGVFLKDQSGKKVAELSEYLGHQTNNYAEYSGLLAALQYAIQNNHKALKVISDSELMVKQIRGQYKVRNLALLELHRRAQELIRKLEWFSIQHVLRAQNREADGLANAAMDRGMGRASAPETSGPSPASRVVGSNRNEFEGVVRRGVVELTNAELPEGTKVQVRVKN